MSDSVLSEPSVSLTESAARRIGELKTMEGNANLMLRLAVLGGGCSGFSYNLSLDDRTNEEDIVFESHGAALVVDPMSLELLSGSTVDFVEDLVGSSFQIDNPNAASTCGCGSSFAV